MRGKWTPLWNPNLRDIRVRSRGYLPHWELSGATYSVTFRLKDSLPVPVLDQLRKEYLALQSSMTSGKEPTAIEMSELLWEYLLKVDAYLDRGSGSCILREPEVALIVANALKFFDGARYQLLSWAVMPNHVHIVMQPFDDWTLSRLLFSIKSFTSKEINKALGTCGQNWQEEYYDRIVRDERDLQRTIDYVMRNPTKAHLENWPWVWPKLPE